LGDQQQFKREVKISKWAVGESLSRHTLQITGLAETALYVVIEDGMA
jgi:hypothetical protein